MGGDGFWWDPAPWTRPLFRPGAAEGPGEFPYHLISPVWLRPSRSDGRQSVTRRRTGTTVYPGLSHGEPFFFVRATVGREDDTPEPAVRHARVRDGAIVPPSSSSSSVISSVVRKRKASSSWTERQETRLARDAGRTPFSVGVTL